MPGQDEASFHESTAEYDLRQLRELRHAIRRLALPNPPGGVDWEPSSLEALGAALVEARVLAPPILDGPARIAVASGPGAWGCIGPAVALSAAALLASPDAARVRQCEGRDCGWVFLDDRRARPRRWCSMAACGNREKARRHHQRRQAPSS